MAHPQVPQIPLELRIQSCNGLPISYAKVVVRLHNGHHARHTYDATVLDGACLLGSWTTLYDYKPQLLLTVRARASCKAHAATCCWWIARVSSLAKMRQALVA